MRGKKRRLVFSSSFDDLAIPGMEHKDALEALRHHAQHAIAYGQGLTPNATEAIYRVDLESGWVEIEIYDTGQPREAEA